MKVRLVEVPVCDLCNRDGTVLQVNDLTNNYSSWTITRCDRHIERLRREGENEQVMSNGEAVHASPTDRSNELREQLLQAIKAEPGMPPVHYSRLLGVSRQTVAYHLNFLVDEGHARTVGETSGKKVWPKPWKTKDETREGEVVSTA